MTDQEIAKTIATAGMTESHNPKAYIACISLLQKPTSLRKDHYCNGIPFIYFMWETSITGINLEVFYTQVCGSDITKMEKKLRECESNKSRLELLMQEIDDAKKQKPHSEKKNFQDEFVGYSF